MNHTITLVALVTLATLVVLRGANPAANDGAAPTTASAESGRPATSASVPAATATMKAVRLSTFGGPEGLALGEIARPVPGKDELLIKVAAAGVNPVDWKIRKGLFKGANPPPPFTLGCDLAGVVAAVGDGVAQFKPGDEVFTFMSPMKPGSFAEFAVVPASAAAKRPATVDAIVAAALPVAGLTAWQALFDQAKLQAGQTVLIHGAAGGVGHIAVQLAKNAGARVIATASKENADFVKILGADVVIDYKATRFEEIARDVDVVLDTIGGETQERSIGSLRKDGILVSIVQPPDAARLKEAGVRGTVFMVRPDPTQLGRLAELVAQGKLRVTVAKTFPLAEFNTALARSEGGHVRGKLVLTTTVGGAERPAR